MDFNLVGSIIDERFKVTEVLGSGGLGTVYRADQPELNRAVALKVLHGAALSDPDSGARFNREARTLAAIEHPHVVSIYSFGILPNGNPYMAMELLAGRTLSEEIEASGPMTESRVVKCGFEICQALSAAHKQGVVHRDLKPQNIMLLAEPYPDFVKVVDFGLSRLLPDAAVEAIQKLTQTGALIGSVQYMSPELCAGLPADPRSDVYSLGCVLYECLTGAPPFDYDNPIGLLHKHRNEFPEALRKTGRKTVSFEMESIIFKALEKDPDDRFQNMDEFAGALELLRDGRQTELSIPVGKARLKEAQKKARVKTLTVAAGSVVLVLGAAIWQQDKLERLAADIFIAQKGDGLVSLEEQFAENRMSSQDFQLALSLYGNLVKRPSFSKDASKLRRAELNLAEIALAGGRTDQFAAHILNAINCGETLGGMGAEIHQTINNAPARGLGANQSVMLRARLLDRMTAVGPRSEAVENFRSILMSLSVDTGVTSSGSSSGFLALKRFVDSNQFKFSEREQDVICSELDTTNHRFRGNPEQQQFLESFVKVAAGRFKAKAEALLVCANCPLDPKVAARLADKLLSSGYRDSTGNLPGFAYMAACEAYTAAGEFEKCQKSIDDCRKEHGLTYENVLAEMRLAQTERDQKKLNQAGKQLVALVLNKELGSVAAIYSARFFRHGQTSKPQSVGFGGAVEATYDLCGFGLKEDALRMLKSLKDELVSNRLSLSGKDVSTAGRVRIFVCVSRPFYQVMTEIISGSDPGGTSGNASLVQSCLVSQDILNDRFADATGKIAEFRKLKTRDPIDSAMVTVDEIRALSRLGRGEEAREGADRLLKELPLVETSKRCRQDEFGKVHEHAAEVLLSEGLTGHAKRVLEERYRLSRKFLQSIFDHNFASRMHAACLNEAAWDEIKDLVRKNEER